MTRGKHAIEKVIAHIEYAISRGEFAPGERIPSASVLAGNIGVSKQTVWNAVKYLKQRGVLEPDAHRFLKVTGSEVPRQDVRHPRSGRHSVGDGVLERFRRDVLTGIYPESVVLPSRKELQARYQVSARTLNKVLHQLEKECLVVCRRNRIWIQPPSRTSVLQKRIVLVCRGELSGRLALSPHDETLVPMVQAACARQGIRMDVVVVHPRDKGPSLDVNPISYQQIPRSESVLGYVYVVSTPENLDIDVLHELSLTGKKVAVIDEHGGVEYPRFARESANFHFFPVAISARAGRDVGQFLLGLGHRHVAFLSHFRFPRAQYALKRLEGLQEVYRQAGYSEGVYEYVNPRPLPRDTFRPTPVMNAYEKWATSVPSEFRDEYDTFMAQFSEKTWFRARRRVVIGRLFQEALKEDRITAWVCVNDQVGVLALEFLARYSRRLSRKISVVGFDDVLEATQHRLTSYNFNMEGLMQATLNYLLRPSSFRTAWKCNVTEVEGFIVARDSTRKAPGMG